MVIVYLSCITGKNNWLTSFGLPSTNTSYMLINNWDIYPFSHCFVQFLLEQPGDDTEQPLAGVVSPVIAAKYKVHNNEMQIFHSLCRYQNNAPSVANIFLINESNSH